MNKRTVWIIGAIASLVLSSLSARPYLQLQGGMPSIKGAKNMIDTGVARLSMGYEIQYRARLSGIGELGVMTGTTYDAGQLGEFVDDHMQLHISAGFDGLVGLGFRLGRLEVAGLGGVKTMKLSTTSDAKQDTLSKIQPLLVGRLAYLYNPNVRFTLSVQHTFGGSGNVYSFSNMTSVVTLNHIPSMTTILVGVQMAL